MEFKRVFNKKRILVLIVLFIINGVFFYRECSDYGKYKIYNELILEFNDKYKSAVDIKKTALSVLREYSDANEAAAEDEEFIEAGQLFLHKVNYVNNYSESKKKQIDNSKAMIAISLFNDKNSFSYLNIIKTRDDLSRIKDEKIVVSNGVWLEKVVGYKLIYYLILIAAVVVIYSFVEDRKNSVIYIQYAAAEGRGKLLCKRIGILLFIIMAVTILFFAEISVISLKLYGGIEGIHDSVCSDEKFAMCSMGLSRIGWLAVNVIRIALAFFSVVLFIWGLLTHFNNSNIGMCGFILLYAAEAVMNRLITDKSIFRFLKFFNIKYLIDGTAWFTYNNWGYQYVITDLAESTIILMLMLGFISVLMIIINSVCCNPLNKVGFVERVFRRFSEFVIKLFSKLPVAVMEMFKVLICQKVWVIIIVIVMLFANMNKGYVLKYSVMMQAVSQFCEQYGSASVDDLVDIREELIQEKLSYEKSDEKDEVYAARLQVIQSKISMLDYVIQKKDEGKKAVLVSQYEYEAALGKNQSDNQQFIALICTILMLVMNAGIVSYEKRKGMLSCIIAAQNRIKFVRNKLLYNGAFAAFVTMLFYGEYYYELIKLYELKDFNISVLSLSMFSAYSLDIPIWGFIALDLVLKIAVLTAIGGAAFLLSYICSYEMGYLASFIMVIPHFLYKLGISVFAYISIPRLIAFMPFWQEDRGGYNFMADMVLIVVGIICYIYTFYKLVYRRLYNSEVNIKILNNLKNFK